MTAGRFESLTCAHCGTVFAKSVGQANRQRRVLGDRVRFFCTQKCCGASKRVEKSREQRALEKAAYDRERLNGPERERILREKHEYHKRTYDPNKARDRREQIKDWHREYAAKYRADPEWKAHKTEYDRELRASEYGEFAEAYSILLELEKEIRRSPWYDRAKERGYYDNINLRKRLCRSLSRPTPI